MRVILSADEIGQRLKEMAAEILHDLGAEGSDLVCVSVLKGSFMFLADLIRCLDMPLAVDFIAASSYGLGQNAGRLRLSGDLSIDIRGKRVLIVEDICDTGQSLSAIKSLLSEREPSLIKTCVLLDKPSRREVDFEPDYVGFEIPNFFVVGYGLDFAERYRNLPYVGVVEDQPSPE